MAWPEMDDFNAGFAALRSELAALREALEPFAIVGRAFDGDPMKDKPTFYLWKRQSNVREEPGITIADVVRAAEALSRPALTGNGGKP